MSSFEWLIKHTPTDATWSSFVTHCVLEGSCLALKWHFSMSSLVRQLWGLIIRKITPLSPKKDFPFGIGMLVTWRGWMAETRRPCDLCVLLAMTFSRFVHGASLSLQNFLPEIPRNCNQRKGRSNIDLKEMKASSEEDLSNITSCNSNEPNTLFDVHTCICVVRSNLCIQLSIIYQEDSWEAQTVTEHRYRTCLQRKSHSTTREQFPTGNCWIASRE